MLPDIDVNVPMERATLGFETTPEEASVDNKAYWPHKGDWHHDDLAPGARVIEEQDAGGGERGKRAVDERVARRRTSVVYRNINGKYGAWHYGMMRAWRNRDNNGIRVERPDNVPFLLWLMGHANNEAHAERFASFVQEAMDLGVNFIGERKALLSDIYELGKRAGIPLKNDKTSAMAVATLSDYIIRLHEERTEVSPGKWQINHKVLHGVAQDMFGGWDRMTGKSAHQGVGVATMLQVHPSSEIHDTMPAMVRGFFDPQEGNQIRGNLADFSWILHRDNDGDQLNYFFDFGPKMMGSMLRLRMHNTGFNDVVSEDIRTGNGILPTSLGAKGDNLYQAARARRLAKEGIGVVASAWSGIDQLVTKSPVFEFTAGGEKFVIAPSGLREHGPGQLDLSDTGRAVQENAPGALSYAKKLLNKMTDAKRGINDVDFEDIVSDLAAQFFSLYRGGR